MSVFLHIAVAIFQNACVHDDDWTRQMDKLRWHRGDVSTAPLYGDARRWIYKNLFETYDQKGNLASSVGACTERRMSGAAFCQKF